MAIKHTLLSALDFLFVFLPEASRNKLTVSFDATSKNLKLFDVTYLGGKILIIHEELALRCKSAKNAEKGRYCQHEWAK
jgi:hypothetical protein